MIDRILLTSCIFMIVFLSFATDDSSIALTRNGKALCRIVVESGAKPRAIAGGAKELSFWLGKISGAEIPVTDSPGADDVVKIILGTPRTSPLMASFAKRFPEDMKRLEGNDGFLIHAEGRTVHIAGSNPKGVLNGVYAFLEQVSDIIFVRPANAENGAGTVYGFNPDLSFSQAHCVEIPALKDHRYYYCDLASTRWQTRNRNLVPADFFQVRNLNNYAEYADMGVKWIAFISLGGLIPKSKYFESHPEFFPLVQGKRSDMRDYNLCFMNPELPKYAAKEVELIAKGLPEKVLITGFGHGDHGVVCRCSLCTVPVKLENGLEVLPGDPNFYSTQYAVFVNRIAKLLAETHPEITIGAGGYLFTAEAPGGKLEPNTAVCFCPYPDRNMKFPIYDEKNAKWRDRANAWIAIGGIPHLYEYYLCSVTPEFYHPVADIVQKDLNFYLKHGLRGMYLDTPRTDSHQDASEYAHDMSSIEYYVISRLMWNPSASVEELRREFCRRAYREAAEPMYAFYSLVRDSYYTSSTPGSWRDHPRASLNEYILKPGHLDSVLKQLDEAEQMARHPASRELITRLRNRFIDLLPGKISTERDFGLLIPKTAVLPENTQISGPDWTGAAIIDLTRFAGNRPPKNEREKSPENFRTTIRLMHDGKNLYIGWIFENTPRESGKQSRDTIPQGASGEMFFKGRDATYHFIFDDNANLYDAKGSDESWNADWNVKTATRPYIMTRYWSAFVTIPLSDLERASDGSLRAMFFDPSTGRSWFGGKPRESSTYRRLILQNEELNPVSKGNNP